MQSRFLKSRKEKKEYGKNETKRQNKIMKVNQNIS